MNFRECVIDCIANPDVVQSFNRLNHTHITHELLARLEAAEQDQPSFDGLDDMQQELLACFILFVHRHIWRKVKLAEARVTRAYGAYGLELDLPRPNRSPQPRPKKLFS